MTNEINPALTGKRAEAAAMWAASGWADVAGFIGPNAHRFERVWAKLRGQSLEKGAGFAQSWCWPALLFGFAWFFYRKMWAVGAVLMVLPIVLGYFVSSNGAAIGLAAASAGLAKSVYIQHATSRIAKIRSAGGGEADIAAAGGVSLAGGIIGGVLLALALAGVVWAGANGVPLRE